MSPRSAKRPLHLVACVGSVAIVSACSVLSGFDDDPTGAGGADGGNGDDRPADVAPGDGVATTEDGGETDSEIQHDTFSPDVARADANTREAGVPNVLDGGDAGAVPCIVGGTLETEPNNDPGTANALAGTACGTITPNIDLVDYFKFTLQPTTTTMNIVFSGNVKVTVTVNGQTVVLLPQSGNPAVPFEQGREYSLKVESNEAVPTNKQSYTLTLEET